MSKPKILNRRRLLSATAIGMGSLAAPGILRAARAQAAKSIHIGYQKYGTLIVLKERGTLEKALAPKGVDVSWSLFAAGPPLLEAMNAGAIDFGTTGETPPIFAQAGHVDLVYLANDPPAPRGEAILVPPNSPIKTVAALKGRKVAVTKGSNAHYLLVAALLQAGLTVSDITFVFLAPPDGRAAFQFGSVDAWAIWDPFFAAAQQEGAKVLTDGQGIVPNHQFFLAARKFADANPEVIRTTLGVLAGAETWMAQNPQDAATQLAPGVGIPASILTVALSRQPVGVTALTPAVMAQQQQIADTFFKLGLIPGAVDVSSAAWKG
jgi:sulfonate transport system substrate-binding protein